MLEEENRVYFRKLYEKYTQSLWAYAYHLSGNKDLSDDIVQTVFLNIAKHLPTLQSIQEENKVKAYLNTATRNTFYNLIRQEQRYMNTFPYDELYKESGKGNSHKTLENTDLIKSMMTFLTPKEQNLICLYYFVGLSIKETAEVMHLSATNTKVTLHYIRKKLKKQFDNDSRSFYEK